MGGLPRSLPHAICLVNFAACSSPAVLPMDPFRGTPEEIEGQWHEQVFRGRGDSMLQLTWRAVLMGSALGGVLSLANLYIGLKAGWGFGVAITACILSYAIWTTLHRIGLVHALGPVKIWSIVIGGLVGVALTLLPKAPPNHQHLVPSPAGVGLVMWENGPELLRRLFGH